MHAAAGEAGPWPACVHDCNCGSRSITHVHILTRGNFGPQRLTVDCRRRLSASQCNVHCSLLHHANSHASQAYAPGLPSSTGRMQSTKTADQEECTQVSSSLCALPHFSSDRGNRTPELRKVHPCHVLACLSIILAGGRNPCAFACTCQPGSPQRTGSCSCRGWVCVYTSDSVHFLSQGKVIS